MKTSPKISVIVPCPAGQMARPKYTFCPGDNGPKTNANGQDHPESAPGNAAMHISLIASRPVLSPDPRGLSLPACGQRRF
jgi:hypothetical protein